MDARWSCGGKTLGEGQLDIEFRFNANPVETSKKDVSLFGTEFYNYGKLINLKHEKEPLYVTINGSFYFKKI